jgi:voltage-gated sodium channel
MQLLTYLISQKFISLRDSKVFRGIVTIIIVISAIYAGLSTYDLPPTVINAFSSVDYFITIFFSIEIIIRIIAERSIFVLALFLFKGQNQFLS